MIDISRDKVAEVIVLARELDRAEAEFDGFIAGLNLEEKVALVAVMWIGRGSYEPEDYDEALETAAMEATTPTRDYLKGTPHLANHLETGMELLGLSVSDAMDDLVGG